MYIDINIKFLSDFNETWIFATEFWKILKYQISWKFILWQTSCSMQMDRRSGRHDKGNSHILQYCKQPENLTSFSFMQMMIRLLCFTTTNECTWLVFIPWWTTKYCVCVGASRWCWRFVYMHLLLWNIVY